MLEISLSLGPALAIAGGALGLAGGLIGSTLGIRAAASAGISVLSEEPGFFRQVIILSSLPMTQTFYGFVVLFIILNTVVPGMLNLTQTQNTVLGWSVFAIGISVFVAELFSAWFQGVVCANGISMLPKTKGAIMINTFILAVYEEFFGILGMVFAILAIFLAQAIIPTIVP